MKKLTQRLISVLTAAIMAATALPASASAAAPDEAAETERLIELVNDYWINGHQTPGGYNWDDATYFVGNTQAYLITGVEAYREYAVSMGDKNHWMGHIGWDSGSWTNSGVFHADNQTCFQTYLDLYFLDGDESKISRVKQVYDAQTAAEPSDWWWWCDAVFMAMPAMSRLYRATGNSVYADKLYDYFADCRRNLYDTEYHLFFRDGGYLSSRVEGMKNFWSRGNGWVLAALAQVLRDMPENWEHYEDLLTTYREMAAGAAACMKDDGQGNKYWTQSMLPTYPVADYNPLGYETSGTAFMTYALMYGINAGLLDADTYLPYAMGGINYLKNIAIQPNGLVGYAQEIGAAATVATAKSTTQNFAVGATLLALCELYKYQGGLSYAGDLLPYLTWRLNSTAVMQVGSGNIFCGGKVFPAPAPVEAGGVWLPLRALAEAMGYTVEWDDGGYASVAKEGRCFTVTPGAAAVRINGVRTELPAAPFESGGVIYLTAESAATVFDMTLQHSGNMIYLGRKLQNLLPCEAGAESVLLNILSSGVLPQRPAQKEKGFNIPSYDGQYIVSGPSVGSDTAALPVELEIDMTGALPITSVSAFSVPQPENPPASAFDGDLYTRFASTEFDAIFDLGQLSHVSDIALSFWKYDERTTSYALSVSADGENYTAIFDGKSVQGNAFDRHSINADIRYIRVVGYGNSQGGNWTSLLEIVPFG